MISSEWTDVGTEVGSAGNDYIIYSSRTGSVCNFTVESETGYLDDWPFGLGEAPPPWRKPVACDHRPSRWLPPRCTLPSLVVRRDFPRED